MAQFPLLEKTTFIVQHRTGGPEVARSLQLNNVLGTGSKTTSVVKPLPSEKSLRLSVVEVIAVEPTGYPAVPQP